MECALCQTKSDFVASLDRHGAHTACLDCLSKKDVYGKKCNVCGKPVRGIVVPHEMMPDECPSDHPELYENYTAARKQFIRIAQNLEIRDREARPFTYIYKTSLVMGAVLASPFVLVGAVAAGAIAIAVSPVAVLGYGVVRLADHINRELNDQEEIMERISTKCQTIKNQCDALRQEIENRPSEIEH